MSAHCNDHVDWGRIRPVCKNGRCEKRTILSVSNCHPNEGRLYWGCPRHGWSQWCEEGEYVPTQCEGDFIEATLLSEYVVPRNHSFAEHGVEDIVEEETIQQQSIPK